MIVRELSKELLEASSEYPVVTVLGPRQSGKTTLVRMCFPEKPYASLEDPDTRLRAEEIKLTPSMGVKEPKYLF